MSVLKYKFVSPGVFVNEIDNSQIPAATPARGPVVIGRTARGPSMRPVTVNSFSEYIETFGDPVPGGQGGDVWRDGNFTSPMYATYAAQAWLKNGESATIIRLLGQEHTNKTAGGSAGWQLGSTSASYGLFLIDSGSANADGATSDVTGTLAAVWYLPSDSNANSITLSGTIRGVGDLGGAQLTASNATFIESVGANSEFTAIITSGTNVDNVAGDPLPSGAKKVTFNFDHTSDKYIRKVFNTNPILTNSTFTEAGNLESHWLAHTFDRSVKTHVSGGAGNVYGIILGLGSNSNYSDNFANFNFPAKSATSGWVISQDLRGLSGSMTFDPTNPDFVTQLFKFHARDGGDWENRNIKISIIDVKSSNNEDVNPYGSFTVQLRRAYDHDAVPQIIEQYTNCNLNPQSENYIAKKIGDQFAQWDDTERRFRVYGEHPNISRFVRVEMNNEVAQGSTDTRLLPFGFWGPTRPKSFTISGKEEKARATVTITSFGNIPTTSPHNIVFTTTKGTVVSASVAGTTTSTNTDSPTFVAATSNAQTATNLASCLDAHDELHASAAGAVVTVIQAIPGPDGNTDLEAADPDAAGFSHTGFTGGSLTLGATDLATFASSSGPKNLPQEDPNLMLGGGYFATSSFIYPAIALRGDSSDSLLSADTKAYFGYDSTRSDSESEFDLSNIDVLRALPNNASLGGTTTGPTEISVGFTLDDLIVDADLGVATYSSGSHAAGTSATSLSGTYTSVIETHGFNRFTMPMYGGWDGWNQRVPDPVANVLLADGTPKGNYAFNTVRRAIDTCTDPEQIDYNLMVVPGVTNSSLTDLMISTCEDRGDAFAIIDLPEVYQGPQEGKEYASFTSRVGTLSSVVSTFEARRKNSSYAATYYPWVQIRDSLNNAALWVPPSVVALGTFSSSDRTSEIWFAPAGFNRGGLSQGSAGLTVTNVSERLTSDNRDDLYEANINPIASFPNEGIVIFGQKTLDASTSALNRINVRRLLIFLKKEISRLSNQVLFDQNVPATWGRFKGLVTPLLESVKIRFGLTDYRLLLDETTTTPDLVDRNILYAKIFLKPARAIEFIALDFIITRTGAAFED